MANRAAPTERSAKLGLTEWTRGMVESRMIEAAQVLRLMPDACVRGYFDIGPISQRSCAGEVGAGPAPIDQPAPSPPTIARMEEVISWNRFLDYDEVAIVWARAEGVPWKIICHRFGISRATANRRWQYALSVIAWRLNGQRLHNRRGRRFLVARVSTSLARGSTAG